jgi:MoxR-like ATPase
MLDLNSLKTLHDQQFIRARDERWPQWWKDYAAYVRRVQGASRDEWLTPAFQEFLWEDNGVSTAGLGTTVNVESAYQDRELAEALFALRGLQLPKAAAARAQQIQASFDEIMGKVSPKHNERRPSARLIRIFAGLFPDDVLCLLDSHRTHVLRRALGMKKGGMGTLAQHVVLRQTLRDVLGEARSVEESVAQSMFSWFLYERIQDDMDKQEGVVEPVGIELSGEVSFPRDVPHLKLLPFTEQRKGIFYIPKALSFVMRLVRFTENGTTREELVDAIREHSPGLKNSSAEMYLSVLRTTLGVIELRDGAFRPSARGQQLLEGEEPSEVLAPVLLSRVFGFAQVLWFLQKQGGLSKAEVLERLRSWYPRWKTDQTSGGVFNWTKEIGLIEEYTDPREGVRFRLTDMGESWASALPADLETRWSAAETNEPAAPIIDEDEEEDSKPGVVTNGTNVRVRTPTFEQIRQRFETNAELKGLVYPGNFLALFDVALRALEGKRFVLLAGLSGTGKTSLARAYAQAYCEALELRVNRHYCEVSVRPDWTDPTGLLGYFNPISNPPRYEETAALGLILEASRNPELPYFLCLDEMNLARVEHYFAPVLSAMEGRGLLQIHSERDSIDGVVGQLPWPRNLFIIGTVNMDETTHAFSDKVLDRAFSFELWDVDLSAWRSRVQEAGTPAELLEQVMPVLERLYQALYPARRHFGYRVCNEVVSFCRAAGALPARDALDAAVMAKVLPKLRGDNLGPLPSALENVRNICEEARLPSSERKARQMLESLKTLGVARFWA